MIVYLFFSQANVSAMSRTKQWDGHPQRHQIGLTAIPEHQQYLGETSQTAEPSERVVIAKSSKNTQGLSPSEWLNKGLKELDETPKRDLNKSQLPLVRTHIVSLPMAFSNPDKIHPR